MAAQIAESENCDGLPNGDNVDKNEVCWLLTLYDIPLKLGITDFSWKLYKLYVTS